jgi:hypothetical protein
VAQLPTLFDDEGERFIFFLPEWLLHKRSEKCSVRRQRGADGREIIIRGRQAGTSQQTASNNNVCVVTHVIIGEKSNGHFSYDSHTHTHSRSGFFYILKKSSNLKPYTHNRRPSRKEDDQFLYFSFLFQTTIICFCVFFKNLNQSSQNGSVI